MYPQYPLASSRFDFYKTEIIIILANIALVFLYWKLPSENIDNLFVFIAFFSTMFFCIEHSFCVIFDKELNSITTITKALFVNKYKISKKYDLDTFSGAIVSMHSGGKNGPTYSVDLIGKNGEIVALSNYSNSNYYYHANRAQEINAFYNSDQKRLKIDEHPFAFRIIGTIFMLIAQGNMLMQVISAH